MFEELRVFYTAVMFYTRLPVPVKTGFSQENLNKATRYFPLIGILVGGIGALTFLASSYILSVHLSVIIALATMIIITGAFHEDAFSDFCDGFGGGYTMEKRLEIMKDSRIGTYGALALILLILFKLFCISELEISKIPFVLISAHALSRLNPVLLIFTAKYVKVENSKSKPVGGKHSIYTLIIAICFGLLPLLLVPVKLIPVLLTSFLIIFLCFRHYVIKRIGGYTGDVLGALQQISEMGFYLILLISEKLT
jgi:adenosylcobinamide-GDP ribazoletransferase